MRRTRISTPDGDGPRAIYSGLGGLIARSWDGVVSTFSPGRALEMRKARMRSSALLAFEAAKVDRLMPAPKSGSADARALPDLQTIRDRCRALEGDDSHGGAARRAHEDNVIGRGIVPQSICTAEATGMSEQECEQWRNACEAWWQEWAEEHADVTGHSTFYDLQRMVAGAMLSDGEMLAHGVVDGTGIQCELIDVDRLESPGKSDTDRIRGGVELDANGRAIAFHVLPRHPFDIPQGMSANSTPKRIVVQDGQYSTCQHVFRRERPSQTRGIPWIATALGYSNHLHHYLNSELIGARSAASYAGVVKAAADPMDPGIIGQQNGTDFEYLEDIEPGTWRYLNPGEDISTFQMNRPGTQFEPFVMRVLRAAWAAPGLCYELVTKDFGGMNYSSARTMLIECRRGFDVTRSMIVHQFCRPWWRNAMLMGIATGNLPTPPGFLKNPRPFLAVRWVPPAYGWIDPAVEIAASRDAVAGNVSTPYDEAARAGLDAEQVVIAKARFLAFCRKAEQQFDLPEGALTSDPTKPSATPPPAAAPAEPSPQEPPPKNGKKP